MLIICAIAAYILTLLCSDQIAFNPDSSSPYYQARLISSGLEMNPSKLSFARIPSVIPDLSTLILLLRLDLGREFSLLLAQYAIVTCTLLLITQTELCYQTLSRSIPRIEVAIIICTVNIFLVSLIPILNQSLGTALTPVHHGGNIILTYLFGTLAIWNPINSKKDEYGANFNNIKKISLVIIAWIGILSNKLFLFTALAPGFLAWILSDSIVLRKNPITIAIQRARRMRVSSIFALGIVAASVPIVLSLFNIQCAEALDKISILRLYQILSKLTTWLAAQPLLPITVVLLLVVIAMITIAIIQSNTLHSYFKSDDLALSPTKLRRLLYGLYFTFLSLSSPFVFLLLIGDPNELRGRYMLAMTIGTPLGLGLIAGILIAATRINFPATKLWTVRLIVYVSLAMGSILVARPNLTSDININKIFNTKLQENNARLSEIALRLTAEGLKTGLSDYWGSELTLMSKGSIDVQPVLSNGEPDLWAHSKNQFRIPKTMSAKNYQFAVSLDKQFSADIANAYGTPEKIIKHEGRQPSDYYAILIYKTDESRGNIKRIVEGKLARFKRNCSRESVDFAER